jgi:hypothetical protein
MPLVSPPRRTVPARHVLRCFAVVLTTEQRQSAPDRSLLDARA